MLTDLIDDPDLSGRVLWYDMTANVEYLDTSAKVADIVDKTARAGFDTIVLDVANNSGFAVFDSDIAPHMSEAERYEGASYPPGYDLLAEVLSAAEPHGIEVHANINAFAQGVIETQEGPAYDHPEWQTVYYEGRRVARSGEESYPIAGFNIERGQDQLVVYTPDAHEESPANRWGLEVAVVDGVVTEVRDRNETEEPALEVPEDGVVLSGNGQARGWLTEHAQLGEEIAWEDGEAELVPAGESNQSGATFVNPLREDVRAYVHSVIEELVSDYDIDGVVLDRARYSNEYADFSDESREAFEAHIGHDVQNWPEDIAEISFTETGQELEQGELFNDWLEFRAAVISDAVQEVSDYVRDLDPMMKFSIYAGAWYETYWTMGVNWGSENYQPPYDWATEDYGSTGYAEMLDFLMTGTYFEDVTREEAIASGQPDDWYSVEGSADMAMEAVDLATFVYGSLFLQQYEGDEDRFRRAMEMAMGKTHGIMIFDLVYLEQYDWWDIVEDVLDTGAESPHRDEDLIDLVRGNDVADEVVPEEVTFTDEPGTEEDTFTIPEVDGVAYLVDDEVVSAGTYPGEGTVVVDAQALDGYAIADGATVTWEHTFSTESGADPGPVAPEDSDLAADLRGRITLDPDRVHPGGTVVVTLPDGSAGGEAAAWLFSEPVSLDLHTVTAGDQIEVVIPADTSLGEHRLVVSDPGGEVIGWAELTVIAGEDEPAPGEDTGQEAQPGAGPDLPATGAPMTAGLLSAVFLGAMGGLALLVRRRLRT